MMSHLRHQNNLVRIDLYRLQANQHRHRDNHLRRFHQLERSKCFHLLLEHPKFRPIQHRFHPRILLSPRRLSRPVRPEIMSHR